MTFVIKGFGDDFSARTYCDVLPGYWVKAMSVENVSSSTDPFTIASVDKCDGAGDNLVAVGIAMGSITSGNSVDIKTQGIAIMDAGGAISAGNPVTCSDADPLSVIVATFTGAGSTASLVYLRPVGIALSTAASGEEVLVNFKASW